VHFVQGSGVKLGWLTEIASPSLTGKIKKAASRKLQATSSLTPEIGQCRMNIMKDFAKEYMVLLD